MRPLAERVEERVRGWGVTVEDTRETPGALLAFGRRAGRPVVVKVLRRPGDEWRSGEVLDAFGGRGAARVLEHAGGAVLMERLVPGTPLAGLALGGRDEEATEILAEVIGRLSRPRRVPEALPTAAEWGRAFERRGESGDGRIAGDLVERGRELYGELCASQRETRLLHGDLQHYNVLFDSARGWTAIDPKGLVGEVEYEVGAALRNPVERPELFASPPTVERRLRQLEAGLRLDADRALAWAFAQAVLSAVWSVEDGEEVGAETPALRLAAAIRPMLPG